MRQSPLKRGRPEASRPTVPGYAWKWALQRLRKRRRYWIATTRPDGVPHLMIIWGVWYAGSFWFSTGAKSCKARNLAENQRCVIGTDDAAEALVLEGHSGAD